MRVAEIHDLLTTNSQLPKPLEAHIMKSWKVLLKGSREPPDPQDSRCNPAPV